MSLTQKKNTNTTIYVILGLLLLFTFFSRLFILNYANNIDPSRLVNKDISRYETPAIALVNTGSLVISKDKDTNDLRQGPGYQLLIAGVYKIMGGQNRYALFIVQILIGLLTILMVYKLAALLWSPLAGLFAVIFMVFSPTQLYYSLFLATEIPFGLLSVSIVYAGVKLLNSTHVDYKKWALLLGLAIAVATLIKTITTFLCFIVVIGIILVKLVFAKRMQAFSWKMVVNSSLLVILPFALLMGSWTIRNGLTYGAYVYTDNPSSNLLIYRAGHIIQEKENIDSIYDVKKMLRDQLNYSTLAERLEQEKALAIKIILSNLDIFWDLIKGKEGIYSMLFESGMPNLSTLLNDQVSTESSEQQREAMLARHWWFSSLDLLVKLQLLAVYFFAIVGFILALKRAPQQAVLQVFILFTILYYIVLSLGQHGLNYSRGRMTFMPLVIVYSGYGVVVMLELINILRNKKPKHSTT
ncbi:MAG TPA: phospholipid carrier-dependent glycosyltransferase [Thiothrix sp.]|nr:phospholipid carrier-dependent glycosyltransferase [Thiothrix sp.]